MDKEIKPLERLTEEAQIGDLIRIFGKTMGNSEKVEISGYLGTITDKEVSFDFQKGIIREPCFSVDLVNKAIHLLYIDGYKISIPIEGYEILDVNPKWTRGNKW